MTKSNEMKEKVVIYTDGACRGNPGPGGWAAILLFRGVGKEIWGAEAQTTNNRMELMAVIKGLEQLNRRCEVLIYSDSAYIVNAVEKKWIHTWLKNNWKTASGKPVKNQDLWQQLIAMLMSHTVKINKVVGHAGEKYNERADKLAGRAAKKQSGGSRSFQP